MVFNYISLQNMYLKENSVLLFYNILNILKVLT